VIKKPRKTRKLKPTTGLWKIKPQWVVTPRKQTNNNNKSYKNGKGVVGFAVNYGSCGSDSGGAAKDLA
jgi:hypothetical protein